LVSGVEAPTTDKLGRREYLDSSSRHASMPVPKPEACKQQRSVVSALSFFLTKSDSTSSYDDMLLVRFVASINLPLSLGIL